MPTYEFECVHGETPIVWTDRTTQPETCPHGQRSFRRLYNFQGFHRKWGGGYSPTIGGYAANEHEVSEALKAASERQSEATGIEHSYKPIDPHELPNHRPAQPKRKSVDVEKVAAELAKATA